MNILLHSLLGELAADGKPVPDGAALAVKAAPKGVPFETLVVPPEAGAARPELPPQARGVHPDRSHPILLSGGLPALDATGHDDGTLLPESAADSPPSPELADEMTVENPVPADFPATEGEWRPVADLVANPNPVPVKTSVTRPDHTVRAAPDSRPEPALASPPDRIVPTAPSVAAPPETPPGHAPLADRPEHPLGAGVPGMSGLRHAPPDHAPAIGLSARPATANTDVETPARSADRSPVVVPATGELPDTGRHRDMLPDAVPDDAVRRPDGPTLAQPPTETPGEAPRAPLAMAHAPATDHRGDRPARPGRDRSAEATASVPQHAKPAMAAHGVASPPAHAAAIRTAAHGTQAIEPLDPGSASAPTAAPDRASAPAHLPEVSPPRSEVSAARPVIGQVVQAIARNLPDGVVELRLQPEELGRLRLAITPGDAGITVQVTAERPETLDLVRRHIDLLASDMRERGFGHLDFTFGHDGGTDGAGFEDLAETASPEEPPEGDGVRAEVTARQMVAPGGRVDVRI